MKICDNHWAKLTEAIKSRGLWHLVTKEGKAAFDSIAGQLQGQPEEGYDPLMACNFMIWGRAIDVGGLYLMTGDLCPVCEAMVHTAKFPKEGETEPVGEAWVESHWIDGPADAALAHCRELGLTSPAQ